MSAYQIGPIRKRVPSSYLELTSCASQVQGRAHFAYLELFPGQSEHAESIFGDFAQPAPPDPELPNGLRL
jgi:hypothetical protein